MANIFIDFCQNCGGRAEIAKENGELLIRCTSCGRTVVICNEDEMIADLMGRVNVAPYAKGKAAADEWNKKGEVNGR